MEQQASSTASSPVRVFFRFRPMDKLETSKRSKDCIELHDNPKIVTIDSPLMGVSDFTFDQVFDEYAPQEEVYKESMSSIPKKLLDGINCTVMAYGQTSTGKTHTMLGERLGIELSERTSFLDTSHSYRSTTAAADSSNNLSSRSSSKNNQNNKSPDMTEGMIPRVVTQIFQQMKNAPDTTEYAVRCSYVEVYLEKIHDLLQPWRDNIQIIDDSKIVGISELCCVDPIDVYSLLARGNAYRTKSSTDRNKDSSRSHAIFTLRLEQIDHLTGITKYSNLRMVDLAGSEVGGKSKPGSRSNKESPVVAEGKMINASLANLSSVIRGILSSQKKGGGHHDSNSKKTTQQQPQSKLAKLLKPAFGSNQYTTIICTGSPSSYNIHETINTIKFGQQARQVMNYPSSNIISRGRQMVDNANLTTLVKLLAKECKSLKASSSKSSKSKDKDKAGNNNNSQIWDIIQKIPDIDSDNGDSGGDNNLDISVSVKRIGDDSTNKEEDQKTKIKQLEAKVEEYKLAKEKVESTFRDLQSDIVGLKSQNELLIKEKQRLEVDLLESIDEVKNLTNNKIEIEHHLRTSQFREREAILFLRQFRTFYFRLLKNKAAHGSGGTKDITEDVSKKIPGVSDLSDLLDVDKVMVLSGLLENGDVGRDVGKDYVPSREALSRSSAEAKRAEHKEIDLISKQAAGGGSGSGKVSISNPKSIAGEPTYGQLTSYRQKLLESPAGRLAMKKERELEQDLTELAKKCATLQNSVIAEKAMVEALSARQGAMGKMKTAQELNTLKQELERKTNDLHAIVWKMNELHLVNKTIDTKVENREHHVTHLEDHVANLQAKNRKLLLEKQEAEKKLREENQFLKNELDGMAVKIWQLGDIDPHRPQPWRSVVPYNGRGGEMMIDLSSRIDDDDDGRRLSLGELEPEEIQRLVNQS